MPNISVDTNAMRSSATRMGIGVTMLGMCASTIENTRGTLPFSDDIANAVNRVLTISADSLWESRTRFNNLKNAVKESASMYEQTENTRANGGLRLRQIFMYNNPALIVVGGNTDSAIGGSVVSGSIGGAGSLFGMSISGLMSGSLLNYNADGSVTYGYEIDEDGNISNLGVSAEGEISASLAEGQLSGSIGLLTGTATGNVGNVSVQGEVGATLFNDGTFAPSLFIGGTASASVLSGAASLTFGDDNNNIYANANGEVLTAEAYARGAAGVIRIEDENGNVSTRFGVEGKVGAEAYVAQGTISGGFEIFGIKFNGSVTGSAGGAGVSAGGSVTTGGVSGNIGAGLGVGGNVSFSVDWSGFDASGVVDAFSEAGQWFGEVGEGVGEFFDGIGDSFGNLFR